jgi:hypothetical protein
MMDAPREYVIKEAEFCIFYDQKFTVLNIDTLRRVYFALFQRHELGYNCLGLINNHAQCILNTKKNNKNRAVTRSYKLL